ncbi:MAG: histidine kinase [Pseudomonadota bacterium]
MARYRLALAANATLLATLLAAPAAAQESAVDRLFAEVDADGNDRLSRGELAESRARSFDSLDTDGDGRLTAAEFEARQPGLARILTMRLADGRRIDANGDGALDAGEYASPPHPLARHDRDGDGTIDRGEAAAALAPR